VSCSSLRKPVPARHRAVALRYAWLRAPPLLRASKLKPSLLSCLTRVAPYEDGLSGSETHHLSSYRSHAHPANCADLPIGRANPQRNGWTSRLIPGSRRRRAGAGGGGAPD